MNSWIRRCILAILVGATVFAISAVAAFQLRSDMYVNHDQWWTQQCLKDLAKQLQEHVNDHGIPPEALDELVDRDHMLPWWWEDRDSGARWTDRWRRPLNYSTNGTDFLVTSYGRDGQPGGMGLDSDLTTDEPSPPGSRPTMRQFWFEMPTTRGFRFTCIMAGILSSLVVLLQQRSKTEVSARQAAGQLVATTILAIIVAYFLLLVHIPNGH